jgi:hypothetical protein
VAQRAAEAKARAEAMEAQNKARQAEWEAGAPKRAQATAKANASSEECADSTVTKLKDKGVTVTVQDYAMFKNQCFDNAYAEAMAE